MVSRWIGRIKKNAWGDMISIFFWGGVWFGEPRNCLKEREAPQLLCGGNVELSMLTVAGAGVLRSAGVQNFVYGGLTLFCRRF